MSAKKQAMVASPLPQVNLLPPEVRAARGLKVVKRWLGMTVVVALVLAAGLVGWAALQEKNASTQLADAQAETARLMAEQAKYAEVPVVLGQLDAIKKARQIGMSTEVLWSPYLAAIAATAPEGVSIDLIQVATTTPMMEPSVPADPLEAPSAGTVTFTADSLTLPDTKAWLDGLETVPGFADAWFSDALITQVNDVTFYTVSATVQFDDTAYSGRFAPTAEEG